MIFTFWYLLSYIIPLHSKSRLFFMKIFLFNGFSFSSRILRNKIRSLSEEWADNPACLSIYLWAWYTQDPQKCNFCHYIQTDVMLAEQQPFTDNKAAMLEDVSKAPRVDLSPCWCTCACVCGYSWGRDLWSWEGQLCRDRSGETAEHQRHKVLEKRRQRLHWAQLPGIAGALGSGSGWGLLHLLWWAFTGGCCSRGHVVSWVLVPIRALGTGWGCSSLSHKDLTDPFTGQV